VRPARLRLVLGATAGLYLGAFVTGWAAGGGLGWAAVLGLLALWTVTMRPADAWSGQGPGGLLRLVAAVGVLAVLATVLWLAGRLAAVVLAPPPLWAGPLIALAALALGRALWSPAREAAVDAVLSEALAGLSAARRPGAVDNGPDPATLVPLTRALDALPDHADAAAIGAVLDGPGRALPPLDMQGELIRRALRLGTPRDRLALALGATDPRVATEAEGQRDLDHAYDILRQSGDGPALALFVARCEGLLARHPASWRDLPTPLGLFLAARDPAVVPDTAAALCRLSRRVRALRFARA
jgi:hypothetical protein